jgi:hypothetical protein
MTATTESKANTFHVGQKIVATEDCLSYLTKGNLYEVLRHREGFPANPIVFVKGNDGIDVDLYESRFRALQVGDRVALDIKSYGQSTADYWNGTGEIVDIVQRYEPTVYGVKVDHKNATGWFADEDIASIAPVVVAPTSDDLSDWEKELLNPEPTFEYGDRVIYCGQGEYVGWPELIGNEYRVVGKSRDLVSIEIEPESGRTIHVYPANLTKVETKPEPEAAFKVGDTVKVLDFGYSFNGKCCGISIGQVGTITDVNTSYEHPYQIDNVQHNFHESHLELHVEPELKLSDLREGDRVIVDYNAGPLAKQSWDGPATVLGFNHDRVEVKLDHGPVGFFPISDITLPYDPTEAGPASYLGLDIPELGRTLTLDEVEAIASEPWGSVIPEDELSNVIASLLRTIQAISKPEPLPTVDDIAGLRSLGEGAVIRSTVTGLIVGLKQGKWRVLGGVEDISPIISMVIGSQRVPFEVLDAGV